MNTQKDWKAKLESAYSFMLKHSKITVCAQTSQEGIKCTKAKDQLRSYSPNIYTVLTGVFIPRLIQLKDTDEAKYCLVEKLKDAKKIPK